MINRYFTLSLIVLFLQVHLKAQYSDMFVTKLTAVNRTSYTDVAYVGLKDTVLVSTFSGRISVRIKDLAKEKVIANLNDEIYSLAYNPTKREIAASTLENGIIIINKQNGQVVKKLPLRTTWSINIFYSDNYDYLLTHDQKGNRYIWAVKDNYGQIKLSSKMPAGRMIKMDSLGTLTIVTQNKLILWDFKRDSLIKETTVQITRFGDMDYQGNILSIDFNECSKYNSNLQKTEFVVKHPNWLRDIKDYPNYEKSLKESPQDFTPEGLLVMNGYSMQITAARFAKNRIYSASIDRSIRVWDKENGRLLNSLTGHKATVNKIKINSSETQMVSTDLKGGIKFWDIN